MAHVVSIFISPDSGKPMVEVERVRVIEGVGLEGDRYSIGKGLFQKKGRDTGKIRHITLISQEAIRQANHATRQPYLPSQTRRNIVVSGIDLNSLVGRSFRVGQIIILATELCTPCSRPGELIPGRDENDFKFCFSNCGGIRGQIVRGGFIFNGDFIELL